jgi:biotin synthase
LNNRLAGKRFICCYIRRTLLFTDIAMPAIETPEQTVHFVKSKKLSTHATSTWSLKAIEELFNLPFNDLMFQAQQVHRLHFDPNEVQLSTLLSIKTGGCPEDCGYCPQSVHYNTGVEASKMLDVEEVKKAAVEAQKNGATRFCMGAAWRGPRDEDLEQVCEMVTEVKKMGLETCVTLGLLKEGQAERLKAAGLDFYNHNIDTSPEFYNKVISTRTFQDRLDTLDQVRKSGLHVCCGGILGMGETNTDRIHMLVILAN